jgi:hypothetical protein
VYLPVFLLEEGLGAVQQLQLLEMVEVSLILHIILIVHKDLQRLVWTVWPLRLASVVGLLGFTLSLWLK